MSMFPIGIPGLKTQRTATPNDPLFSLDSAVYLPQSVTLDSVKSRDPLNTGDLGTIRGGNILGKITSGGKFAPSIISLTGGAYTSGTSLTIPAEGITELVRRIGASGTFKLTGPPTAGGVTRTVVVTYSAASGTTATITALGTNQVDQINFNAASTGGNLQLRIQKPDGTFATTANIAWNATDATYLAAINTQLDASTGVAGSIVATAIAATDPDLGFILTYSNAATAYPNGATSAQVALFPTTSTSAFYTRNTNASDARFVTGSFVQPTDGSEFPLAIQGDPWGVRTIDELGVSNDAQMNKLLVGGILATGRLINYPADLSLRAWLLAQLEVNGNFIPDVIFTG